MYSYTLRSVSMMRAGVLAVMIAAVAGCILSSPRIGSNAPDSTYEPATQSNQFVALGTAYGRIVIELDRSRADLAVDNFLRYFNDGFYDGTDGQGATIFHDVVAGVAVTGGLYTQSGNDIIAKTAGNWIALNSENGLSNTRGTVAMVPIGVDANGQNRFNSVFSINVADNTSRDSAEGANNGYVVFGWVVEGMDIVDAIAAVTTTQYGSLTHLPADAVTVLSVQSFGEDFQPQDLGDDSGNDDSDTTDDNNDGNDDDSDNSDDGDDDSMTYVQMQTTKGNFVLELNEQAAPNTVANFVQYVNDGFYDGNDGNSATIFHRVIDGFMVQAGGLTADLVGKTPRDPIAIESNNGLSNVRGAVAMARTNDPDSATSQFFVNTVDNSGGLDYQDDNNPGYTVFGKVVEGMDTIDAISASATHSTNGYDDVPVDTITITSAQVLADYTPPAE